MFLKERPVFKTIYLIKFYTYKIEAGPIKTVSYQFFCFTNFQISASPPPQTVIGLRVETRPKPWLTCKV